MTIIAAITLDRAIGRAGDTIYHISADLKRFKEITMGHPLVMGRRTFESFPKGPLPGRRNLVVTRNKDYSRPGIETFDTLEAALAACGDAEPMVIGGGQIYAQTLPMADRLLLTEIDAEANDADAFFPDIDPEIWTKADEGPWLADPKSGISFRYVEWQRKKE